MSVAGMAHQARARKTTTAQQYTNKTVSLKISPDVTVPLAG
jgi:hypothetical protein